MPPPIALSLCILFIFSVFVIDFKRRPEVSSALWIPLIWLMIMASRPVAQWIYPGQGESVAGFEEGNPIDRAILSILIVSGVFVLLRRRIYWGQILKGNSWLVLFFVYCGVSIFWSDFPAVAFKRWIRAIGSLMMVLVVLSESDPVEAIKTLIRRCAYVLIPVSILLIKYYWHLGVAHEFWTGKAMFAGVTTDKNALGRLCLVCGMFFLWNIVTTWGKKTKSVDKKGMLVDGIFLLMILLLLIKSGSATSVGSFIAGWVVFMGLGLPVMKRSVRYLGIFIMLGIFILGALELSVNLTEMVVKSLGRDMTLTERTYIWTDLLSMGTDPLFGTGYDTFWLGRRLETIWIRYPGLNEAHSGYLEAYLEVGVVGLVLLTGLLISSYRKIRRSLILNFDYGRVGFTVLVSFLLYNVTEAAYKATGLMFFVLLLIGVDMPLQSRSLTQGAGKDLLLPTNRIFDEP